MKPLWQLRVDGLMRLSRYIHTGVADIPAGKEADTYQITIVDGRFVFHKNFNWKTFQEPTPADKITFAKSWLGVAHRENKITLKEPDNAD